MKQFILVLLLLNTSYTLLPLGEKEKKELQTIESTYKNNFSNSEKLKNQLKALQRIGNKDHLDLESREKVFELTSQIEHLLPAAQLMKQTNNIDNPHCTVARLQALYQSAQEIDPTLLPRSAKPQFIVRRHNIGTALLFKQLASKNQTTELPSLDNASVCETDKEKNTPLHIACKNKKYNVIHLFENFTGFNGCKNSDGYTPFLTAAAYGDHETVLTMLDWNDVNRNDTDEDGNNALLIAIKHDNYDAIPTLLNYNFDINSANAVGQTAMHIAVENKNPEIVSLLLKHYPELTCVNDEGNTPLDTLLSNNTFTMSDQKFIQLLKELKNHNAPLNTLKNDTKANMILKIDLNIKPQQPKQAPKKNKPKQQRVIVTPKKAPALLTPQQTFYRLMECNQLEPLELYIQTYRDKINMNYEDSQTLHPLLFATKENNLSLVKLLLTELSDPNYKSKYAHKHPLFAFQPKNSSYDLQEAPVFIYSYLFNKGPILREFCEKSTANLNTSNKQGHSILDCVLDSNLYNCTKECEAILAYFILSGASFVRGNSIFPNRTMEEENTICAGINSGEITIGYNKQGIHFEVKPY